VKCQASAVSAVASVSPSKILNLRLLKPQVNDALLNNVNGSAANAIFQFVRPPEMTKQLRAGD